MHIKLVLEDVSGDDLRKLADIFGTAQQLVVPSAHEQKFGRAERQVADENKVAATSEVNALKLTAATEYGTLQAEAPAVQVNTAEKDSTGLAYDDRIHSSSKGFNKDGSWKKKRGVDQLIVDTVEAELRGVRIDVPTLQFPVAAQTPAFPAVNPAPVRDFNTVLSRIQAAFREKRMTPANIQGLNINLGVNSITDITGNEQLVNAAHSLLDQYEVK